MGESFLVSGEMVRYCFQEHPDDYRVYKVSDVSSCHRFLLEQELICNGNELLSIQKS